MESICFILWRIKIYGKKPFYFKFSHFDTQTARRIDDVISVTDVLTTFWRPLWSITEQTHGNVESICFILWRVKIYGKKPFYFKFSHFDRQTARRIDDVIIKTFALCYFKMAKSLDDILADWVNEDFEKILVEAVVSYDKQEKERKSQAG